MSIEKFKKFPDIPGNHIRDEEYPLGFDCKRCGLIIIYDSKNNRYVNFTAHEKFPSCEEVLMDQALK